MVNDTMSLKKRCNFFDIFKGKYGKRTGVLPVLFLYQGYFS